MNVEEVLGDELAELCNLSLQICLTWSCLQVERALCLCFEPFEPLFDLRSCLLNIQAYFYFTLK
jgi:hypothetical protein